MGNDIDPFVRACLVKAMHRVASDQKALNHFTGAAWLTYRQTGRRLRTRELTGGAMPGMPAGHTFPEMLGTMAAVLANRHGQVLCQSLIEPGLTGALSIGHAMNYEPHSRGVLKPRRSLVGVIVQLDGQELLLAMDHTLGIPQQPSTDQGLTTLVSNTWALAETVMNMSQAPTQPDAAELAQQILDCEPVLTLRSGSQFKVSGSHVEGTDSYRAASEFVARAAAAAAAEGTVGLAPPPPGYSRRAQTVCSDHDVHETVAAYSRPRVDPVRVVARTFRNVE